MSFVMLIFFFSSRRRHTRCALVTGVQTCALPISNMLLSSMLIAMQREDGPSEYRPVCISRQYGTILTMPLVTHSPEDRILGFIEAQLESEWSDGLPIVPPTPAAVEKFIHCSEIGRAHV